MAAIPPLLRPITAANMFRFWPTASVHTPAWTWVYGRRFPISDKLSLRTSEPASRRAKASFLGSSSSKGLRKPGVTRKSREDLLYRNLRVPDERARLGEGRGDSARAGLQASWHARRSGPGLLQHL